MSVSLLPTTEFPKRVKSDVQIDWSTVISWVVALYIGTPRVPDGVSLSGSSLIKAFDRRNMITSLSRVSVELFEIMSRFGDITAIMTPMNPRAVVKIVPMCSPAFFRRYICGGTIIQAPVLYISQPCFKVVTPLIEAAAEVPNRSIAQTLLALSTAQAVCDDEWFDQSPLLVDRALDADISTLDTIGGVYQLRIYLDNENFVLMRFWNAENVGENTVFRYLMEQTRNIIGLKDGYYLNRIVSRICFVPRRCLASIQRLLNVYPSSCLGEPCFDVTKFPNTTNCSPFFDLLC
jgi:hypothetical protein